MRYAAIILGVLLLSTISAVSQLRSDLPRIPGIEDYPDPHDAFSRMLVVRYQVLVNAITAGDRSTAYDMRTKAYLGDLEARFPDVDQRWQAMKEETLRGAGSVELESILYARSIPDRARLATKVVNPDSELVSTSYFGFVMFSQERGAWRVGRTGAADACAHCSHVPVWVYVPEDAAFRLPGE